MKFSRIGVALSCLFLIAAPGILKAQATDSGDSSSGGGGAAAAPADNSGAGSSMTFPGAGTAHAEATPSLTPSATPDSGAAATPKPTQEAAAPIKLPEGFGGGGAPVITPGEGRFAQPPFRFSLSLSQGYDDNVIGAPDNPVTPAPVTVYVPKVETFIDNFKIVPDPKNPSVDHYVPVYKTGTFAVPTVVKFPTPPGPIGSAVTRTSVGFQTQAANPRTVYTLDLSAGAIEYWSRPGDTLDYNGSGSFLFFHKVTPRMNFTAGGSATASSQPNYGDLYGPNSLNPGQYITANLRANLDYRLTPRIASALNYNLDTTLYMEKTSQQSDIYNNTLGAEFHYLLSPRTNLVLNYRTSEVSYPNFPSADSTEQFLLVGGDFDFTRRLHFTFRTGGQSKQYDAAGSTGLSSPYFESSLNYIYGKGSTLNWTTRYGFEENPDRNTTEKTVSIRTGMGVNHVLTAKLSANAGINYNRLSTTSTVDPSLASNDNDQISLSLGLNFVWSPHLTLYANWTFTKTLFTISSQDSSRNQTFLGATYNF